MKWAPLGEALLLLSNIRLECKHRHLSKQTALWRIPAVLYASLVLLMAAAKKDEKKAIKTALVVGT